MHQKGQSMFVIIMLLFLFFFGYFCYLFHVVVFVGFLYITINMELGITDKSTAGIEVNKPLGYFFMRLGKNVDSTPCLYANGIFGCSIYYPHTCIVKGTALALALTLTITHTHILPYPQRFPHLHIDKTQICENPIESSQLPLFGFWQIYFAQSEVLVLQPDCWPAICNSTPHCGCHAPRLPPIPKQNGRSPQLK